MEVRSRSPHSGPVLAAVFALIVLGVGSLYLTWQSIQHQRTVVEDHMALTGSVIARGVEANLVRLMRSMRGNPAISQMFPSLTQEFFQEITESEEVAFAALYGPEGTLIIGSEAKNEELTLQLPEEARLGLQHEGQWHGMAVFESAPVLVVALTTRPGMATVCGLGGMTTTGQGPEVGPNAPHDDGPGPDLGPGQGFGPGRGLGHGRGGMMNSDPRPHENAPPVFLVVGLSAERHLAQFRLFRRAALLQTGYVFGAAVLLWLLAFAYLKRRNQAWRVGQLERFQSKLLDNMPDGLVTLDMAGEIIAANPSAMRLLDPACSPEGCVLTGRQWSDFPFSDPDGSPDWTQHEYRGRRLEILAVPFQDTTPLKTDQGEDDTPLEARLILIRDRTAIRTLEEDLEEAKRLATIGSLAAGVAHEVRNPLSSLRGFAQFFAEKFKSQQPYGDYATTMVKEADRLNRVVTDLLYLSKPREIAISSVSLPDTLASLQNLMRFDIEYKRITLEVDLDATEVAADPDGLTQVLLNLISNSLDAVSDDAGRVRVLSRREAGGVRISVEDNGPGIPAADHEKALEPFFTTKKKGTGLGLAIVNTILRAHKGRISIAESDLGGTRVDLFFPSPIDADRSAGQERT